MPDLAPPASPVPFDAAAGERLPHPVVHGHVRWVFEEERGTGAFVGERMDFGAPLWNDLQRQSLVLELHRRHGRWCFRSIPVLQSVRQDMIPFGGAPVRGLGSA